LVLLPRRLDVNVQAEQAKDAEAPFANVDGGSEATHSLLQQASAAEPGASAPGGGGFLNY